MCLALQNTNDIVLVPDQEDEVEIENVIHPAVVSKDVGLHCIKNDWFFVTFFSFNPCVFGGLVKDSTSCYLKCLE